jgi:hypothetical protein
MRSRRLERGCLIEVRDLGQPGGCLCRLFEVARRDPDLDRRRQQPRFLRQADHLVAERAPDGGRSGSRISPREEEERAAGLRIPPILVGLPESLLRLRELTETKADLADLVERRRGDPRVPGTKLLARAACFDIGPLEIALEPHHLGPVHPAHAGKGRHRVRLAELACSVRPLAGAVEVGDVAARADRVAVDDQGRVRIELAAQGGDARLVEQRAALGELSLLDERIALPLDGADLEAAVAEPAPDVFRLLRLREGALDVVMVERLQPELEREVSVGCGLRLGLEQALRSLEPTVGDGALQLDVVVVRELRRDVRRPRSVPRPGVCSVRALLERQVLVDALRPHSRFGQKLEVFA